MILELESGNRRTFFILNLIWFEEVLILYLFPKFEFLNKLILCGNSFRLLLTSSGFAETSIGWIVLICSQECSYSFFILRGNSSVGRAQPCQGWCRGFESRFPLKSRQSRDYFLAALPSGPRRRSAKPLFVGSNPTAASNFIHLLFIIILPENH